MSVLVGIESGGGAPHKWISVYHRELTRGLGGTSASAYCPGVDLIHLAYRISGDLADFGGDGPSHIRRHRRSRKVTADIDIPRWKERDDPQAFFRYMLAQLGRTGSACLERLARDGELVHPEAWLHDWEAVETSVLAGLEAAGHEIPRR